MPNTNIVLTQFKGDATSFIAAVKAMQSAMSSLNTNLNAVTTSNQKVAASTNNVAHSQKTTTASTIAMGSVMGALALKALSWGKSMASSFTETGVHVRKLQEVMGGSAEEMSRFIAVMSAYKIPFDAIVVSYRTFAIQAVSGTKAFRDLGLSLKNEDGTLKSALDSFGEASDALNKIGNDTQRTAAAGVLFGRRYKELLPVLALGSEGIKQVAANASKLGIVLDEAGVKKAVAFTQTQTMMHQAMQGLSFTIMTEVVPALTRLVTWTTTMIISFKDYLKANPEVVKSIINFAKGLLFLWGVIKTVSIAQTVLMGASTLEAIGKYIVTFGLWVASSVTGYGAVATAASISAAASLSAWAATGIGLLVVGAAVAGAAVLVNKMMNNIKGAKLDVPKFTGFAQDGTDVYTPGSGLSTGKSAQQKAAEKRLKQAKEHLKIIKDFWNAQVDAAKEALDATKSQAKKYEDYIKDIADNIKKSAEVPSLIEESFAQYLGPANLVNAFRRKVQDAKDFLSALTTLRDAGLDPGILGQLAAAGPQAGLAAAKVILTDVGVIGELNSLQGQLTNFAGQAASLAGQYVNPSEYAASVALPGVQAKYDTAVAGQTAGVAAGEKTVKTADKALQVIINANTNASPTAIAKDVAFGIQSGMSRIGGSGAMRNKFVPTGGL